MLGTAIDQYAIISASEFCSELFDYTIRIAYRDIEVVNSIDEIEHKPFREALRCCDFECDVEVHYVADLPARTGLGSSSTFSVALLQAPRALKGKDISGLDLAYEAIHFERKILGEHVGCQDQTFAAVGRFNTFEFCGEDDIRVTPVNLSALRERELEDNLIMFYTGVTRRADDVVRTQLGSMSNNKDRYLQMRGQVDRGMDILAGGGPIEAFGELLDEAWQVKRGLHSVISNDLVDQMYERACDAGAIGGKLLGAGSGGFLLLFVPPDRQDAVSATLSDHLTVRPRVNAPASAVIFNGMKMRRPIASERENGD